MAALLASFEEAAGEIAYVRRGSMLVAGLGGKIADADLDTTARARQPLVPDLALTNQPSERSRVISCDGGGFGKVDDAVGVRAQPGLDLIGCPLEGAGRSLGVDDLTQLLGLGADLGDRLVNGAGFRGHEKT